MQLKSISYTQYEGKPEEWSIEGFTLGPINLIVGRNASGKTRALNIIGSLGKLLSGETTLYISGDYEVIFDKGDEKIVYRLKLDESKVFSEKLVIGSRTMLDRGKGGIGEIYAEKIGNNIEFQAPDNQLACLTRRDSLQHPFFEDLYQWGKSLRHYYFGTQLGKDHYAVFKKGEQDSDLNLKDANQVVAIFRKGRKKFPSRFIEDIKTDMKLVGYEIEEIDVGPPTSIVVRAGWEQPEGILVKESDLRAETDQNEISQGMFRALSLIIQLNYSALASVPSCILIDDIGEGLDYERASALIKLLIEKAKKSCVQLVMSTNDRFVMNNVPL
ncbi:ATP-binding protein, partial [bacterium]|nr:ATP-binding protein [bacterium]